MTVFEYLRTRERSDDSPERIVSFIQYDSGRIMLATNHNVYEIKDGKIEPIEVMPT